MCPRKENTDVWIAMQNDLDRFETVAAVKIRRNL